jgi:hypothetical protein
MTKTFTEIGDEAFERIYGMKIIRKERKNAGPNQEWDITFLESPEDIAREQARRQQQMRNAFRNDFLETKKERKEAEPIIQENKRDIQLLRSRGLIK